MRKTKQVTIPFEGRDKGKVFLLTEMPVLRAEKWAIRAFLALAKAGVEVPDNVVHMGMAGIASSMGLETLARVSFKDAETLMDDIASCISSIPSPNVVRALDMNANDIEEVATLLYLKREALKLHWDFSSNAES